MVRQPATSMLSLTAKRRPARGCGPSAARVTGTAGRNSQAFSGKAGTGAAGTELAVDVSVIVSCTNLKHPYLCTRCLANPVPIRLVSPAGTLQPPDKGHPARPTKTLTACFYSGGKEALWPTTYDPLP